MYQKINHNIESQKAQQIASISNGDLNHAQRLIQEVEDDKHKMFQDWMRMCFAGNHALMVEQADEFSKSSKINQKGLFQYGLSILRDSLLLQHNASGILNLADIEKTFAVKFSKTIELVQLEKLYMLMNSAFYHLERNGNPKIIFLDTSLQITSTFKS